MSHEFNKGKPDTGHYGKIKNKYTVHTARIIMMVGFVTYSVKEIFAVNYINQV